MSRVLGNDVIQHRINEGNSRRDALIAFISEKVGGVHDLQKREIEALSRPRDWWKDVSDSQKTHHTKPDPTQWAPVARAYEEALYQLAAGRLGLGAQLLEHAHEAENRTRDQISAVVNLTGLDQESGSCAVGSLHAHEICTPIELPESLEATLRSIERCEEQAGDPPVKGRVKDPWWGLDEEEEEENEQDG